MEYLADWRAYMSTRTKEAKPEAFKGGGNVPAVVDIPAVASTPQAQSTAPQAMAGGGGIVVTHTIRKIKAYNFTESDLETISVTNIVSGASFAIASGIISFCFDLNKDLLLTPVVPPSVEALRFTINWGGIPVAALLIAIGIAALIKRGTVISRVKRDSENVRS